MKQSQHRTQLAPIASKSNPPVYPPNQQRTHLHLCQQFTNLYLQFLVVTGRLAERVAAEGQALVAKVFTIASRKNINVL